MPFSSTLLRAIHPMSLSAGGNLWTYGPTTNSSTEVAATGFFAGCGAGSRGGTGVGMLFGDIVLVAANTGTTFSTTGKVTLHSVLKATANVASTLASSGYGAAYDVTLSAGTTV